MTDSKLLLLSELLFNNEVPWDSEEPKETPTNRISVLLHEPSRVVGNLSSEVIDREITCRWEGSCFAVIGDKCWLTSFCVVVLQVGEESSVTAVNHLALIFKHAEETAWRFEEVEREFVVCERDGLPRDSLVFVVALLELEHSLAKRELKLLVREVYARLLEGVLLEYLEAEDVEDV